MQVSSGFDAIFKVQSRPRAWSSGEAPVPSESQAAAEPIDVASVQIIQQTFTPLLAWPPLAFVQKVHILIRPFVGSFHPSLRSSEDVRGAARQHPSSGSDWQHFTEY